MALEWEFVEPANCVVVTWGETFEIDAYMAFYREFAEAPDFRVGMSRLRDLRRTRLVLTSRELGALSARIQRDEHKHGERKVVFLTDSDLTFGVVRQFIVTAAPLAVDYHISREPAEAKYRIGLSPGYVLPADRRAASADLRRGHIISAELDNQIAMSPAHRNLASATARRA